MQSWLKLTNNKSAFSLVFGFGFGEFNKFIDSNYLIYKWSKQNNNKIKRKYYYGDKMASK